MAYLVKFSFQRTFLPKFVFCSSIKCFRYYEEFLQAWRYCS